MYSRDGIKFMKLSADNKTVFQAASIIQNEIKSMKDTMPWPSQAWARL